MRGREVKMMRKKMLCLLLSLCMLLSLSMTALADNENQISSSGGTGTSTVQLTVAAATFSATVPTALALTVNADSSVTCPSDVCITNGSSGTIKLTGIAVKSGEWTLTNYNGGDRSALAAESVNAKKLGLQFTINGTNYATSAVSYSSAQNTAIAENLSQTIAAGGTLPVTMAAIATASSSAETASSQAAYVIFTLACNTV